MLKRGGITLVSFIDPSTLVVFNVTVIKSLLINVCMKS